MREGKLGDVKLARSIVYGRRGSIGDAGKCEMPASVDYNLWAGPAPRPRSTRPKFHYDWHWVWDTGNGELGNNNVHSLDICRWGLGVTGLGRSVISYGGRLGYRDAGETPNTQVCVFDFGDKTIVSETRGLKTEPFHKDASGSWIFYGTRRHHRRHLAVRSRGQAGPHVRRQGPKTTSPTSWPRSAAASAKTSAPTSSKAISRRALCHIGNISWRLGRTASAAELQAALEQLKVQDNVAGHLRPHAGAPARQRDRSGADAAHARRRAAARRRPRILRRESTPPTPC